MLKPGRPKSSWKIVMYTSKWFLLWYDPLNYVLVKKKDFSRFKKFPKKRTAAGGVIEGWYFPIFPAIKALLYREMEEKILEKSAYKNAQLLLLDLREALDKTAKEIEVSL